jgi:hypothetical protein
MSCYSLKDQHRFNPMYYDEGREYTMEDVAKLVQKMRNEWKVSYRHRIKRQEIILMLLFYLSDSQYQRHRLESHRQRQPMATRASGEHLQSHQFASLTPCLLIRSTPPLLGRRYWSW